MNEAYYATIPVAPGDENPAADAFHGVYERYRPVKEGDRVLDLGAHAGYFTRIAAAKAGPTGFVVAFEPHPMNFRRLQDNCSNLTNVACVQAGAWNSNFLQACLWESVDNSGGHSFTRVDAGQKSRPIICQLVDIGKWLSDFAYTPTFVKIDTELAEYRIIPSLIANNFRPYIAAEVHNQESWDICRTYLHASNYKLLPESEKFENYYLWATP